MLNILVAAILEEDSDFMCFAQIAPLHVQLELLKASMLFIFLSVLWHILFIMSSPTISIT